MTRENYYTAPPQIVFEEIKKAAIEIWQTYDNEFGYVDEKVNRIKDMQNIKDNAWYIVSMFDFENQQKLINRVSTQTALMIVDAKNI